MTSVQKMTSIWPHKGGHSPTTSADFVLASPGLHKASALLYCNGRAPQYSLDLYLKDEVDRAT